MRPPFSKGSVEADGKGQPSIRKHPKPAEPKEPKEHWWNEPTKIRRDPRSESDKPKLIPPPPFPPSEEERARLKEEYLHNERVRPSINRVQAYERAMNPPEAIPRKYHWWDGAKVRPDPKIARLREQGFRTIPAPVTFPSKEDYVIYREERPSPHPARPTHGHGDEGRSRDREHGHGQSTRSQHNSQRGDQHGSQRSSQQERRR